MAPIEASTGVPLPIYQSKNVRTKAKNRHHAYFLESEYKVAGPGYRAVRFARLQKGNKGLHILYHEMVAGAEMPASDRELFNQTLLGYAGYVPQFAVDVAEGELNIVELEPSERDAMRRKNVFQIERRSAYQAEIGSFLMNYAIWQDFEIEKRIELERFLSIRPRHLKKKPELRPVKERLAANLLDEALDFAVEPISKTYTEAKKERALKVGMPACALALVKSYVGEYLQDYVEPLHQRLALVYGQTS